VSAPRVLQAAYDAFATARPEGWAVILLLIIPIFLAACAYLGHALMRWRIEDRVLRTCQGELESVGEGCSFSELASGWFSHTRSGGLIRQVVESILAARDLASPDLEAMATVVAQSEASHLWFPRLAPNLLLLAGLLGTVFGLAGVVGTLGPQIHTALAEAEPTRLAGDLAKTLEHMQSAFACTLWGILAAILVTVSTRVVARKQDTLVAEALEFGFSRLVPRVYPKSQQAQIEDLQTALRESRRFLKGLPKLMETAAGEFERVLQTAGASMTGSLDRLHAVSEAMQKALTDVAGDVRVSAEALQTSAEAVKGSADDLNQYHQDVRNAYVELRRTFDESQLAIREEAQAQLHAISDLQQRFDGASDRILMGVQDASKRLLESTEAFATARQAFTDTGHDIIIRLDGGFQQTTERFDNIFAKHEQGLGQIEAALRLVPARLESLARQLDPRALPAEEWAKVTDALRLASDSLSAAAARMREAPSRPAGSETSDAASDIRRLIAQLTAASSELRSAVQEMIAEVRNLRLGAADVPLLSESAKIVDELTRIRDILSQQRDPLAARPTPIIHQSASSQRRPHNQSSWWRGVLRFLSPRRRLR
jgi:hypothetical protein